jgi:hypothetical protein
VDQTDVVKSVKKSVTKSAAKEEKSQVVGQESKTWRKQQVSQNKILT